VGWGVILGAPLSRLSRSDEAGMSVGQRYGFFGTNCVSAGRAPGGTRTPSLLIRGYARLSAVLPAG
jgi:hypothetical protein